LLDVEDLVLITQRLLIEGANDTTVNVATGISTPVDSIVRRIVTILGLQAAIVYEPGGERQRFDIAHLRSLLGPMDFDLSYPDRLLDRYVPGIAANTDAVLFLRTAGRRLPAE